MNKSFLDYTLRIRLPLIVFTAAIAFVGTFFFSRAERDGVGYAPVQPIAFSHRLHAGMMQIDCQYCHSAVASSPHATVPALSTCMNCHTIARKNKPEIMKLANYYEKGIALPWKRIHRVPDYAYFNHSVHVNNGIKCANCHGSVDQMDSAMQVSEFTMGACLNCHRDPQGDSKNIADIKKGPENCAACHR
jgi:hypothetical protein